MGNIDSLLQRLRLNLGIKGFLTHSFLVQGFVTNVLTKNRLKLPTVELTEITDPGCLVSIRILPLKPWDTPYDDIVALCAIARSAKPRRILEIGTARGRTTLLLSDNCPEAEISTYDIDPDAGSYFSTLNPPPAKIRLRICDVQSDAARLQDGEKFDFIFIDANHIENAVRADSELAFELLAPGGLILWHDYANSDYLFGYNRVPEVLAALALERRICGVGGTELAVYQSNA
jgi:SAM-dependent methyltransferase